MTKERKNPFPVAVALGLLTAASLLLGTSCSFDDEGKKDDSAPQDDRFAFLRQEEAHPTTTRHSGADEKEERG